MRSFSITHRFILSAIFSLTTLVGSTYAAPNILFIMTDDQRPDTIHALGNDEIRTPNLDQLVHRGTTFTRAITAIPICVASRAELLTGRDGRLNGKKDFGFSPKEGVASLGTVMHDAGYETCYVGKWHTRGRPSTHGYETVEGLFSSGGGKFPLTFPKDWKGMDVTGYRGWIFQTDDGKKFPEKGVGLTPNISDDFTDAAIRFLNRRSDRPFFLHVNYTAPHDPLFVPEGYEGKYTAESVSLPVNFKTDHPFDHGNAMGRDEVLYNYPRTKQQTKEGLAVYYAVIEHLDAAVGKLLDDLESKGLDDETIVIFSSDHGLAMGSHGLRGKQNMYEHSIGVPLIFAGPNIPEKKLIAAQCYLRDLYPTICDFAGATIPETVQGKSIVPVIEGKQKTIHDVVFGNFKDSQQMVRTDRWKYIRYPIVKKEQLFDLDNDPSELINLVDDQEHALILNQLRTKLSAWEAEAK